MLEKRKYNRLDDRWEMKYRTVSPDEMKKDHISSYTLKQKDPLTLIIPDVSRKPDLKLSSSLLIAFFIKTPFRILYRSIEPEGSNLHRALEQGPLIDFPS